MPTDSVPIGMGMMPFRAPTHPVVASFDGGNITSNTGALLLGQVDRGLGLVRRFAACFTHRRNPGLVAKSRRWLVSGSSAWR
jgi:hypothetical protein